MGSGVDRLRFGEGVQTELLRGFKSERKLSERALAELFGVSRRTLRDWLHAKYLLPAGVFTKIYELNPAFAKYNAFIECLLPQGWGKRKGGVNRVKKFVDLQAHYTFLRTQKDLSRQLRSSGIKRLQNDRNSLLDQLVSEGIDLYAVLATCLLTDGSLVRIGKSLNRISFSTNDEILRSFMYALLSRLSLFLPSVHFTKKRNYLVRVTDECLAAKLLRLSPAYVTSPGKIGSIKDYLSRPQPTVSFLSNADEATKKWCARFAFTTDGCISVSKSGKPELAFACYHPYLPREWQNVFASLDIRSNVSQTKNSWCGYSGTRTRDLASIEKFAEMGGFIPGVKISGKSKRFKGMEKNALLQKVVNGQGRI